MPITPLPAQPFFSTPEQRLALARQRYFEEGVRPSGLVSEGVIQSWSRCVQARRDPVEKIAFNPVTSSRIHSSLARARLMLQAAAGDLNELERTLAGTACTAILTDAQGVVVHATRSAADHGELLLPLARRIGVSIDEEHIGTAAPGITMRSGQPCSVVGGEHFFGSLQGMHCAAAPIRDVRGRLAGVLDVTCEGVPFGFDAAAVVGLYATSIENQLLRAQSHEHLIVNLQTSPSLLGTPMEGLAGLDARGEIAWVNHIASRLLGVAQGEAGLRVDEVFGVDLGRLTALTRETGSTMHRLPNGLAVWLGARLQAGDGAAQPVFRLAPQAAKPHAPEPAVERADAAAGTLRDSDRELVQRTVLACQGNVSKAARALGVSRGLVYRHLKDAPAG